jgi:WD40 repeat protein
MENYESREFQGHKKSVFSLDWNSEGTRLGSASSDGSIRIWTLESYLEKGIELRGHTDMIE